MPTVSVVKGRKNPGAGDIDDIVAHAIELLGGIETVVAAGDTVLIKPNVLLGSPSSTGATTNPFVVASMVKLAKTAKAKKVIVGESSAVGFDTEESFRATGMREIAEKAGAMVVDLKRDEAEPVFIPNAKVIRKVLLPKTVVESDVIINVPVMKTHDMLPVTLALKNMKGCLFDEDKKRLHRSGLSQGIVDINKLLKPDLALIDGIVGMEGNGPIFGDPVELDMVIASRDSVAADAVASYIMGFYPKDIEYIRLAAEQGLGEIDLRKLEILGELPEKIRRPFKKVKIDPAKIANCRIIESGACTGCRHAMETLVLDLEKSGDLDLIKDHTVVLGQTARVPPTAKPPFIIFGLCVTKYKNLGVYVPGCPPRKDWVIEKVAREEGKKIKAAVFDKHDSDLRGV